jgi:hypothetical protein
MRDLTDEPPHVVAAERARVATEGWGAELLRLQGPRGNWFGPDERHGYMHSLYVLTVLKDLGLDPDSEPARTMIGRVKEHLAFEALGNRPFLDGETEPCINGRILMIGAIYNEPHDALAEQLLSEQLDDGGWNCEAPQSRRSSFHSTICVLEGLLAYERAGGVSPELTAARQRAEAYLLDRRMMRSLRTGEIVDKHWLRFAFPPVWHYDVLRGLDYLREAEVEPDARIDEAIEVVIARRHQNGRWPLNRLHKEAAIIPVAMETEVGRASRWNTLRALRVLRWSASARARERSVPAPSSR